MKTKISMMLLLFAAYTTTAQEFSDKWNKELSFEKPGTHTLMIFNVNGTVDITSYNGDKLIIEAERIIKAKTDRRLEVGKAAISTGVMDRADTIMLFTEGSCNKFGQSRRNNNGRHTNGWGYIWEDKRHQDPCNEEYDYTINYKIKVPAGINVYASTINDGDVNVADVTGQVVANNINGSIALKNLAGTTHASTINGSVDLNYVKNPSEECRYYSLNGDINANFKKGLGAELAFESFNGAFYTNIDPVESYPVLIKKVPAEAGIKYKISGNHYKIGKGGPLLDFETFNGNVYLREN